MRGGPWQHSGMSQVFGSESPRDHAQTSHRKPARYLVVIESGGFTIARLFLDTREQVAACVNLTGREGLDFLVLDQTRPDIEAPVVRVVVPGLRHFYRRFALGRLYDVPVKLGLRKEVLSENELNPLHPQT